MPLFKKKRTKEEEQRIKKEYVRLIQKHVKLMEELFTEDLIESIPENGIGGNEYFNEKRYNFVLNKFFFLNMVISRMIAVDLKEFVDANYEDEIIMSLVSAYLIIMGIGVADETREGSIRYGL